MRITKQKNACFTCQMTGEFSFNRDTFFEKNNSNKRKFLPQIVATFFYFWLVLFEFKLFTQKI
ncbi:hypothetical protein BpHYR1_044529 [Brachionus plicatilis]|uniref:Uncharacterized protein n=1 Tax=Brachionus plicatilis TaxID=10195 RepID=A0A3M7SZ49_BRAPC|nr:hypothetical protein BpHYR1_044529 [Brachionus plicatilis]